ncbi:hypothetical protein LOZ39_000192 [Ophidiomyces ophidiicola]|uniref:Uncharacterized protein n=1 Tax=Ophidiomyces ophidiicola TaxID=1387563 RepID=A0ACB8V4X8_9EURO|nr:hypothetical protein LOZ64_000353 [Ophidiomyces ophidiicola]KAI1976007.1 hypothetical protein LOZ56_000324 [Ophidiomyces ophidiicola]KAI2011346.1 hypothetical protein LOZ50_000706 [Ophidiomyces ophidiicola]KAI2034506.1 hypothetical protein LOZ45_000464 [Ophidiomyces ophidiicola]KAI2037760.1 hypothetical protein LOZ48_000259 [Ophidiomyces ophidiicola]
MDEPMSPGKWQVYLAAFQEFQKQSAFKYRAMKQQGDDKQEIIHTGSQNMTADPLSTSSVQNSSINASMGTASTVLTSSKLPHFATVNANTPPSTLSSRASGSGSPAVNKMNRTDEIQFTTTNKSSPEKVSATESSSTASSFMLKIVNSKGLTFGSTPEPSMSVNFSNPTMTPKTPDPLETETVESEPGTLFQGRAHPPNGASKEIAENDDSSGSDEVVFRQDEHNRVGPPLHHLKQLVTPNKILGYVGQYPKNKHENTTPGHSPENKDSKSWHAKNNPEPKFRTQEDKQAALRRAQDEALNQIHRKRMGVDEDEPGTRPLHLAREGPGTDPTSEIVRQIKKNVDEARDIVIPCLPPVPNEKTSVELTTTGYDAVSPAARPSTDGHENEKFQPVLVDWQYRPWYNRDDKWTKEFGGWLEYTMRLGCYVDMDSEPFTNPDLHPDGITGFIDPHLEEPITYLDDSQGGNAHAHETAAGYVYNWNLRLDHERVKEIEDKEREIAHRKAVVKVKPEPHPYAPKTNVYIRPVEVKDIPGLTKLYNWYVRAAAQCIDLDDISQEEMKLRVEESENDKLPCLVAAERKPGCGNAMNSEDEMVYGFILASDFSGPRTSNRYAAQLELFVNPKQYNRRIGRSLLDKMLELCDPKYAAKHGYDFDCAANKRDLYCGADVRPLSRLIFMVNHPADDPAEYQWLKGWLETEFEFHEQGLLKGTAIKNKQVLNCGFLVRDTPLQPQTKEDDQVVRWSFG